MTDLRRASCMALMRAALAAVAAMIPVSSMAQSVTERLPDPKCGLEVRLVAAGLAEPSERTVAAPAPRTKTLYQAERTIGAFRFLYDTSGTDAPALLAGNGNPIPGTAEDYIDSAGAIFNLVRGEQLGTLGYIDPFEPGQTAYDVYIVNSSYYGETVPEGRIGSSTPARYRTHIVIDNDYRNFYSPGMAGLKVTAAHEFFHAIQFGSYGYWSTDPYFMELTSTWMEDLIYPDVNDYYQYLRGPSGGGFIPRGHFARPDFPFQSTDGLTEYSRAIFGKFLEKRFSAALMRRTWELVPSAVAVKALDEALGEAGSSFREAFLQWASWNAHTGPGADTAAYYSEGLEYPRIVTAPVVGFTPPSRAITDTIGTASAFYYPVTLASGAMAVIVANLNTVYPAQTASFRYEMAESGDGSFKRLSNGLYVKLVVSDPEHWATIESAPALVPEVTAAPNPFEAGGHQTVRFLIPASTRPEAVRLTLLTGSMERVFQGELSLRDDLSTPFTQVAVWDGRDRFGAVVGSGVYVYVIDVDGAEHTGKLAVVR